jgi:DNA repair exonuclease SbcCD ATPase subunit
MKAILRLKNIGGLREGQYTFDSNKLNIVESANSAGKTSIVKALVGVLSIPSNGALDEINSEEAQKLGIKPDPGNPYDGFVNVHADQGIVELDFDEIKETYVVKQSGETLVAPKYGDERFLLTGILSDKSRVLRQLRGLDRRESDDFKWAVDELSYAQKYSEFIEILQTERENLDEKKDFIKKALYQLEPLKIDQKLFENKLKTLEFEIDALSQRFFESKKLADERNELDKHIYSWEDSKQKATIKLTKIEKEFLTPKLKEIKDLEESKKQKELELKEKRENLVALKQQEFKKKEIEKSINELINQRNNIDGLLNLFIIAENNLKNQENVTTCPLCKQGHIDHSDITKNISNYRSQRNNLNEQILRLNQEKQNISIQISNTEDEIEELLEIIREITNKIKFVGAPLKETQEEIKSLKGFISDYEADIKKVKPKLKELDSKISEVDSGVNKEYNEKNKLKSDLHQRLGSIRQQISSLSSVEIYDSILSPDIAKEICDEILEVLNERIKYLKSNADKEREEAAKKFNENISELMVNLGFTEFKTIKLSGAPSYRLYVERFDPDKKDYKSQEVGTLSTSEKLAIALILQIALKETYMKKLPFLILDDVLEGFDPERSERIIEYLQHKVKQEDWFIIATRLVESINIPGVTYLE